MIRIQNVQLRIGAKELLASANVTLHSGQHYGLIGRNGTGKTSLFKLILGQVQADAGELSMSGNPRLAHMAQEVSGTESSAIDHVLDGDALVRDAQVQIEEAKALSDQALVKAWEAYEQVDGYSAQNRAEQLLQGLGFQQHEWAKPVSSFSGGWRVRLSLAQALMCPSDVLLLDEPTNHLDLDAALWLESWLRKYTGTLLLVSHDRDFLDQVVGTIVHLDQQSLTVYRGNYAAFERQKAERMAQQQSMYEKQQAEVAHIESFIRRFRAKASKAKQAQGRIKALERMEVIAPAYADSPFSFRFPEFEKTSNNLITLDNVEIGYDTPILSTNINILHDTRVALLGSNGAGKSTFVKTLVGQLSVLDGQLISGEHLRIGYFAQHQVEALDMDANALLHLQRLKPNASEQELRNFLGGFGWQGDRVFERVRHFSGGEKVRLALAMIAIQRPNLLLLDEPTNHLDLEARHALTRALQEYRGAIVVISHDRHLLRQVVDEYWLVADGRVVSYEGGLDTYQQGLHGWVKKQAQQVATKDISEDHEPQPTADSIKTIPIDAQTKKQKKRDAAAKRAKLSPVKKRLHALEAELEQAQGRVSEIESGLADPAIYQENHQQDLQQLMADSFTEKARVEMLEKQWFVCQEELEGLESGLESA